MPTGRAIAGIAIITALGLGTPLVPLLGVVWQTGCLGMIVLLLLDYLTRPGLGAVAARRDLDGVYHVGRDVSYGLTVRNTTSVRLRVTVREFAPAEASATQTRVVIELDPGGEWTGTVRFSALRRGAHMFPHLGIGVSTRIGLLEHRRLLWNDEPVRIAPGRPSGEIGWLLSRAAVLEEAGSTLVRRPGADWEFEGLRDYVTGDEPRRIDWKASARRHRPMVREYETERNTELLLALDCGRLMGSLIDGVRKLDLAMTPVLDIAAVALQRGERVGLLAFDSKPRIYLPPRSGMQQLHFMTNALAELPECDDPTSYLNAIGYLESRHRKRLTIIIFTDFTDEITSRELVINLATLVRRHQTVFVAVADPHLERIFQAEADSDQAIFEKAVAGELCVERRTVLDSVQNLGIPTLDAEPHRLSGPLLNRYLELRMGGEF